MLTYRRLGLVLANVLILLAFTFSSAFAGWIQCRSDPVVILSNGMTLDLSADIGTLLWDVEHVDYVLHVPQGVNLVASIATPSWPTTVETFTVYNDAPAGQYHSEITVYTNQGNASVTANTVLLSPLGLQLGAVFVPGVERETLHAYINVP